ncbi:DUF986 family protein [Erwinia mallotivora]|uniref:DUF986 family protein n=1 Tax=Erwinia mallotivora TaxID=69222 RepID=UPI0021BFF4A2|nr:DUF986 family protein [Erwinia mallotivora]
MTLTDCVIALFIALFLLYAIWDEVIIDRLKGKTGLKVQLKRRNRLDSLIFVGLIAILIYQNVIHHGSAVTRILLMLLAFMALYLFWFRQPRLLLKASGFYHAGVFIHWERMKSLNLSEDGILLVWLENRRLLIHVRKLDDLDNIYQFMIKQA